VDRIRRLVRRSSDRSLEGAFVLEGPTMVDAALAAGAPLEAVYVAPPDGRGDADRFHDVLVRAATAGVAVRYLAPGVLERVSATVTPQGLLAVCGVVTVPLGSLSASGFVLVGVDIADPGNAGTMIRSADAAGAAGVVFTGASVDVTNPKVVRAAAGSMFHLPVVAGGKAGSMDAGAVLVELARTGRRVLGAAADVGEACDQADLSGAVAIVVGNEAHGLPDGLPLDGYVHVPMAGRAESLNVAMAATVLCYEAARQRRHHVEGSTGRDHG
jgi:RNA methyltransferase, TrmH family